MKCINCGKELNDGVKFCDECGSRIDNNSVEVSITESVTVETSPVQEETSASQVEVPITQAVEEVSTIPPVVEEIVPNEPKNNKKIIIIIISIILIIGIILAIVFLLCGSGSKNNNSNNDTNNNYEGNSNNENGDNINKEDDSQTKTNPINKNETAEEKSKRLISGISEELYCELNQDKCVLIVKNNNNENINVVLGEMRLLDSNNKILGTQRGPLYANGLGPGETGYILIRDFYRMGNLIEYDHYEIDYYLQDFTFNNHKSDLTYTVTKDDDKNSFVYHVKNNSDELIDNIDIGMLFYKNDKLVAIEVYSETHSLDDKYIEYVKPQEEFLEIVDYPYVKGYNGDVVDYDRYETFIREAYRDTSDRGIRYRKSHMRDD